MRTLRTGCLWWVAPPCSTWIFLSRGSTGRTYTRARGWGSWVYVIAVSASRIPKLLRISLQPIHVFFDWQDHGGINPSEEPTGSSEESYMCYLAKCNRYTCPLDVQYHVDLADWCHVFQLQKPTNRQRSHIRHNCTRWGVSTFFEKEFTIA